MIYFRNSFLVTAMGLALAAYKQAAREAAGAVRNERDLARMKKAVREVSLQRVYMRNEMFKEPLTSNEIKACLSSLGRID